MKTVAKNVAQQIKQLGEDVFETAKKQPGEMAGKVLEQMGVTATKTQVPLQQKTPDEEGPRLERKKAEDKAKSQQQIAKIEAELKEMRRIREEQLRQRRQQQEQATAPVEVEPLQEPTPKRRRGILGGGFWDKRIKTAREQAQPEMVGRRVGG